MERLVYSVAGSIVTIAAAGCFFLAMIVPMRCGLTSAIGGVEFGFIFAPLIPIIAAIAGALLGWFLRQRYLTLALAALLVCLGAIAFEQLVPHTDNPTASQCRFDF